MLHVGSERSLPTGSLADGAVYLPTGVTATMRDLELVIVLAVFSLEKSWKILTYFGGCWNGHTGNDLGEDDVNIGP